MLIAEDDAASSRMLQAALGRWGYDIQVTRDGEEAWQTLRRGDTPSLAILNWMMPGINGVDLCRKIRGMSSRQPTYVILLTAKSGRQDIVTGLRAGADDYVTKPFDADELLARVQVGERVVSLQSELAIRVSELEDALSQVKRLQGLLPICSYCKRIRDDRNYWQEV